MLRKMFTVFLIVFIATLLLLSCTQAATEEAVIVEPTETSAPATETPVPPTDTPEPTATFARELAFGETMVREKDGMEMVSVPSGWFMMGSSPERADWVMSQEWCADCREYMIGSETGLHDVYLDAYWIDKYEVTNAQYELCVENGACSEPLDLSSSTRDSYYGNPEYADYPVINVIVPQAKDYCEWVGGSLPTEAQWEKAAHGTDERPFPWGEAAPTCDLANFAAGGEPCVGDTAPVGSYPDGVSPYGAMDMAGNVTEWVLDGAALRGPDGYEVSGAINPFFVGDGLCHFHRGGDWYLDTFNIRSQRRLCSQSNTLDDIYTFGFRCMMAP